MNNVVPLLRPPRQPELDSVLFECVRTGHDEARKQLMSAIRIWESQAIDYVTVSLHVLEGVVFQLRQTAERVRDDMLRSSLEKEILKIESALWTAKEHLRELQCADSARCRPPFRNDLAHRSDLMSPTYSEMISPTVPG